MKLVVYALLTASLIAGPHARAGDTSVADDAQVHGVKLASICSGCGVVSEARTETRKSKTSGVGAIGGAVVGGVIGHQIGNGAGQAVATAIGAVGGGVAGNAVEKKVKKVTVWITTVTFRDGSTETYEARTEPGLNAGDIVKIRNGQPVKHSI